MTTIVKNKIYTMAKNCQGLKKGRRYKLLNGDHIPDPRGYAYYTETFRFKDVETGKIINVSDVDSDVIDWKNKRETK